MDNPAAERPGLPTVPAMTLQIGADVGPYTVLRAARREARHARTDGPRRPPRVWLAEPFAGGEPVALIVADVTAAPVPGPSAPDGTAPSAALLRREWALSGSLRHPHLATVHDLLDTPDGAVLVTDWADRGSVADLLSGNARLSAGQTVTLLAGVCAALTACHERGLVHGDVTPHTVLVDGDGRPLLTRVGRTTAAVDSGTPPLVEPRCASPDVARGRAATAVDDVFSMGAVAMQCLTGRPAWPAQDLRDVVVQSEFGQWPRIPESAGAGPELTALVDAMLDADPAARPTVREVGERLSRCGPPLPLPVGTPSTVAGGRGRHAPAEAAVVEDGWTAPGAAWDDDVPAGDGTSDRIAADRGAVDPGRSLPAWRRFVLPVLLLIVVIVGAVAAGVWWAGLDRPLTAGLPTDTSDVAAGGSEVTGAAVRTGRPVGRLVGGGRPPGRAPGGRLRRRRPGAAERVYTVTAPGLAADAARIRALADSGVRVDGLRHQVSSVAELPASDGRRDPTGAGGDRRPAGRGPPGRRRCSGRRPPPRWARRAGWSPWNASAASSASPR